MRHFVIATTLVGLSAAAGCGDDGTSEAPLKVALLLPFSGVLEGVNLELKNAAELALREVNAAGGIGGRTVEFEVLDTRSDPTEAVNVVEGLLAAGPVAGFLGPNSSAVAVEVQAPIATAQVPQVSCCASSPILSTLQPATDRYFFRTIPPDNLQGKALAIQAERLSCERLALMHLDNAYGNPFVDIVGSEWTAGIVSTVSFPEDRTSYATEIGTIAAANPDCVITVGFAGPLGIIAREIRETPALANVQIIMSEAGREPEMVEKAGSPAIADGVTGVSPQFAPMTPEYADFAADYEAAYGMPEPGFAALSYDAAAALLLAMAAAADPEDGPAVRDQVFAVTNQDGGDTLVRPGEIARGILLLQDGVNINYDGAANSVDLDSLGNVVSPYVIWEYQADVASFVETGVIAQTSL